MRNGVVLLENVFDPELSEKTELTCDPAAHTENELEQHDEKVDGLLAEREEMRKVSGGYAFRFPASWHWVERVSDFVRYERKCCPFLTFEIAFEPEERGLWLYLGGEEEVEDYLVEGAEELDA